jgi:hypothetical protein
MTQQYLFSLHLRKRESNHMILISNKPALYNLTVTLGKWKIKIIYLTLSKTILTGCAKLCRLKTFFSLYLVKFKQVRILEVRHNLTVTENQKLDSSIRVDVINFSISLSTDHCQRLTSELKYSRSD